MVPYKAQDQQIRSVETLSKLHQQIQHERALETLHNVAKTAQDTDQRVDAIANHLGIKVPRNTKKLPRDVSSIMPVSIFRDYPTLGFKHSNPQVEAFYLAKRQEYEDEGSTESIAHAFAEEAANEYAEELSRKKPRIAGPPAAGPAAAGPEAAAPVFDAKIHADMQAAQKISAPKIKELLVEYGHIADKRSKAPPALSGQIQKNSKIFGLLHYLEVNGIDPSTQPDQGTLDAFTQYKADHGMPIDDDWDGTP